jgi:hypothetical protein
MSAHNFRDLTGAVFGRLTVIERAPSRNDQTYWRCHCLCGNETFTNSWRLTHGQTASCGCLRHDTPKPKAVRDLTGLTFDRLTVIELHDRCRGVARWRCRCECGSETISTAHNLTSGRSKSCGCLSREMFRARGTTHGLCRSPEYGIWNAMRQRCENPNNKSFPRYGAKGITVCQRWTESFESFLADMGPRPSPSHSLDRVDGTRGYEPSNVRWATMTEQNRNRKDNRILTHNGESHSLAEWSERTGISDSAIRTRLRKGWTVDDALTIPVGEAHRYPR